jgi:hypothetical protein
LASERSMFTGPLYDLIVDMEGGRSEDQRRRRDRQ